MVLFQKIKSALSEEKRKYTIVLLIGILSFSYFSYLSYLYNIYIVDAEVKEVLIEDINCSVRSGKTGSRSEIYFNYQEEQYKTTIPKKLCNKLQINDSIELRYIKQTDEFGYTNQTSKPRFYIGLSFVILLVVLLIKVVIK